MKKNVQSITFTNYGYLDFTLNLLESIKKNNVDLDLLVYCTDKKSFDYLNKFNNNCILLDSKLSQNKKATSWKAGSGAFGEMMISKFESIFDGLLKNDYVLYIDGDIVIKENILEYLENEIEDNDFLFQLDYNNKRPYQNDLCAGFMMIKSTRKTKKIFNPNEIDVESIIKLPAHDQTYLNNLKNNFKYKFLSPVLFPNGSFYFNYLTEPKIIHFNYVVGKAKKNKMRKMKEWYI